MNRRNLLCKYKAMQQRNDSSASVAYGILQSEGVDTKGMSPKEAWEAVAEIDKNGSAAGEQSNTGKRDDEDNEMRRAEKGASTRGYTNVSEVQDDLLSCDSDVIAHQTNCKGLMSAGVAKQINEKLLEPEEFGKYESKCKSTEPKDLLGQTQFLSAKNGKTIANLFGEDVPTGHLSESERKRDTDYDALRKSMDTLASYCKKNGKSVAFPAKLGCGLAGGDWTVVKDMIYDVFGKAGVKTTIVSRKK